MSGKRLDKPQKKAWTTSKVIAIGVLVMDAVATLAVLALCGLAIVRQYEGALPYLTTLIGRPPRGGRGLKYHQERGAVHRSVVALLAEGVD